MNGYLAYGQPTGDLGINDIKVSSTDQYARAFAICCATRLDSIDFTKFDVLGLSTVNRGSSGTYPQDVQRDDFNKKIIYTVTERWQYRSSPVDGRGNFVIVPKLPADCPVEYIRNQ